MRTRTSVIVAVCIVTCHSPVRAWTPPLEISAPSGHERSTPRIARGPSGTVSVVYLNKGSPWSIFYRQKSAAGHWGPVEKVSTAFAVRPDVVEDAGGRPHVIFAQTATDGAYDLYHAWRTNGTWMGAYLGLTSDFEDEPRLAADAQGRIHLIYTPGSVESSNASVKYRIWNDGVWSAETDLGSVNNAYYHRPDITIDPVGNLHAVWIQESSGTYRVRYRKQVNGTWAGVMDVGSGSNVTHFFNFARVAVADVNNVCVVWHDNAAGSQSLIRWNYSSNAGASFAFSLSGNDQGQTLYNGHYPQLDSGTNGSVHLVSNLEPSQKSLVYSRWSGGPSWVSLAQPIHTNPYWQGWPDITEDTAGNVHAVVDNPYGGGDTNEHHIAYLTTAVDTVAPAPVTGFMATAFHNSVRLNWNNPHDPDFNGTMIRFSTAGTPAHPADGTLLADRTAQPGSGDVFHHTGVTNGTIYYYAAFAHDGSGLFSPGVGASARPSVPMDRDADGDVDQVDFAAFQNCLGPFAAGCSWADSNQDFTFIDPGDLTAFLNCWSGPDVSYAPACAD